VDWGQFVAASPGETFSVRGTSLYPAPEPSRYATNSAPVYLDDSTGNLTQEIIKDGKTISTLSDSECQSARKALVPIPPNFAYQSPMVRWEYYGDGGVQA
jgi:hypothetical protein